MQQSATIVHFPRVPLAGAIGLVCFAVLGVAAARIGGVPPSPGIGDAPAVQSRLVSFEELAGGALTVRDAETKQVIATLPPGGVGFLRGSMRGLMYSRKRDGVPFTHPFRLEYRSNGQLVLTDTSDGVAVELTAFGRTGSGEFRALLVKDGGGQK